MKTQVLKNIETLESIFKDNFPIFILSLSFYIDYNDKTSAKELYYFLRKLDKQNLLHTYDKVYKLIRINNPFDYIPVQIGITSSSKEKLSGNILEEMKETVSQYKKSGDFYYIEIENVKGIDINEFYKMFKNRKRELIKKYDSVQNQIFSIMFDTFVEKFNQQEFIICGNYKISDIQKV